MPSSTKISVMYRQMQDDPFPPRVEVSYVDGESRQTLVYEKVTWNIDGTEKGLRYGENPDQPAALYRLSEGALSVGGATLIGPGHPLCSGVELIQSGKHPGKINLTDVDSALSILRYLDATPCAVVVKHNNPCGVARDASLAAAYEKAHMADRIAAFGGAVTVNREMDSETAELIAESYCEVVAAPEYAEGTVEILARRKNLRIMRIGNIARLAQYAEKRAVEARSLVDGGMILQLSFIPRVRKPEDLLPAQHTHEGKSYTITRKPSDAEYDDMLFGWIVESGVTSNSVIYVKNGVTVGIGTGEQDRVGVAEIARFKAYRNAADRLSWQTYHRGWLELEDEEKRNRIQEQIDQQNAGLSGSTMISDAYFPFRDGVEVGLREGVTAVLQPGGSLRDFEVIQACNEHGATMMYTGQRSFRH